MKVRRLTAYAIALTGMVTMASLATQTLGEEKKPATKPSHRVVAMYFHRTNRCATCRKISEYIEESLQSGFSQQLKDGQVSLSMIDFQDPKNQEYTDYYNITGPTLVLADVRDGKVATWKPEPKVWSLVRDKDAFSKFLQGEVRGYLETK